MMIFFCFSLHLYTTKEKLVQYIYSSVISQSITNSLYLQLCHQSIHHKLFISTALSSVNPSQTLYIYSSVISQSITNSLYLQLCHQSIHHKLFISTACHQSIHHKLISKRCNGLFQLIPDPDDELRKSSTHSSWRPVQVKDTEPITRDNVYKTN